jgi:hypothetical protein
MFLHVPTSCLYWGCSRCNGRYVASALRSRIVEARRRGSSSQTLRGERLTRFTTRRGKATLCEFHRAAEGGLCRLHQAWRDLAVAERMIRTRRRGTGLR